MAKVRLAALLAHLPHRDRSTFRESQTLLIFAICLLPFDLPFNWRATCTTTPMLDPLATKLEHYMDLLGKRQQLVATNIANADTPGYKTKDMDFQFEFMSMLEGGTPNVIEAPGLSVKNDGN